MVLVSLGVKKEISFRVQPEKKTRREEEKKRRSYWLTQIFGCFVFDHATNWLLASLYSTPATALI
jgi:hypothetical protein